MLSKIIAAPFVLAIIVCGYLAYTNPYAYSWYLLPPVLAIAVILIMRPQIDWYWYQKHPPKLEEKGLKLLTQFFPYFNYLDDEAKMRFLDRLVLIRLAKDYISQSQDKSVPEDAKLIFAANQAQLTIGLKDYLLLNYEKVVVYPSDFPSPKYPHHFHASEVFEEDTVNGYIFSLQHMLPAFMEPQQYYNVTMHELAHSLILTHPQWPWPLVDEEIWPALTAISKFPSEKVKETVNRPDFEPLPACLTQFMTFPIQFKAQLPELYQQFNQLLKVYR